MVNRFTVYGCRGTVTVAKPDFMEYGGNTSSYVLKTDKGNLFFLDAGTGIREAAASELKKRHGAISLLLSHGHPDHIVGLGCSALPYQKKKVAILCSSVAYEALDTYHSDGLFPASLKDEMPAIEISEIADISHVNSKQGFDSEIRIDDITISFMKGLHPNEGYGGSTLFKFRLSNGNTLVYATDTEFDYIKDKQKKILPNADANEFKERYINFIKNADLLLADAQYAEKEYNAPGFNPHGWGHSYIEQIIELANKAQVKEVILTHHDPNHTDNIMDDTVVLSMNYGKKIGFKGKVTIAQEGLERCL